jgi:hypothetical protein
MDLLAIDPGAQTGWARGRDGKIVECGLLHILDDFPCTGSLPPCSNGSVVIEKPIFRYSNNRVDPNDLISLGVRVGRVMEAYLHTGNKIETVFPSTWKASVPKAIHERRIEQDLAEEERCVVLQGLSQVPASYRHNVWDAVGLALWWIKKERQR